MITALPILIFQVGRSFCVALTLITVGLTAVMSVMLLLSSGTPGRFLRTLEQRIATAGGLVGLSYAGCHMFWHFYGGLLYSRWSAICFYVGWKTLGGMFMALLICVLRPRNVKALIWISGITLLAFSLLIILTYSTGRLTGALLFPSLSIGLILGISIYCGVLLREKAWPGETVSDKP